MVLFFTTADADAEHSVSDVTYATIEIKPKKNSETNKGTASQELMSVII